MFRIRSRRLEQRVVARVVIAFFVLHPCAKQFAGVPVFQDRLERAELLGKEPVIGAAGLEMRRIPDRPDRIPALCSVDSQRFFAEDMFPRSKGPLEHIHVHGVGCGDIHGIRAGFFQCFIQIIKGQVDLIFFRQFQRAVFAFGAADRHQFGPVCRDQCRSNTGAGDVARSHQKPFQHIFSHWSSFPFCLADTVHAETENAMAERCVFLFFCEVSERDEEDMPGFFPGRLIRFQMEHAPEEGERFFLRVFMRLHKGEVKPGLFGGRDA